MISPVPSVDLLAKVATDCLATKYTEYYLLRLTEKYLKVLHPLLERELSTHLVTGRLATVMDFLPPTTWTWFLKVNIFITPKIYKRIVKIRQKSADPCTFFIYSEQFLLQAVDFLHEENPCSPTGFHAQMRGLRSSMLGTGGIGSMLGNGSSASSISISEISSISSCHEIIHSEIIPFCHVMLLQ